MFINERLSAIETGRGDTLLEAKVARIDTALAETKSALDRLAMKAAEPAFEGEITQEII